MMIRLGSLVLVAACAHPGPAPELRSADDTARTPSFGLGSSADLAWIARDVACVADFDGDGLDDVFVTGAFRESRIVPGASTLSGTGPVHPAPDLLLCGDVNGDGYADGLERQSSGDIAVYLGGSSGLAKTAASTVTPAVRPAFWRSAVLADHNGDGRMDLWVNLGQEAELYLGTSSGLSSTASLTVDLRVSTGTGSTSSLHIADVDDDGTDEMVAVGRWASLSGAGTGTEVSTFWSAQVIELSSSTATLVFEGTKTVDCDYVTVGTGEECREKGSWTSGFVSVDSTAVVEGALAGGGDGLYVTSEEACSGTLASSCTPAAKSSEVCDASESCAGPVARSRVFNADFDGDGTAEQVVLDRVGGTVTGEWADPLGSTSTGTLSFTSDELFDALSAARGDTDGDGRDELVWMWQEYGSSTPRRRLLLLRDVGPVDADGDGYDSSTDCDDSDASIYPGASEIWYDGVDQDCAGDSDYDQDADGVDSPLGGGFDCDDTDPTIYPSATEIVGDEIDQDCSGTELCFEDADDDGVRPGPTDTVASTDLDCTDSGEATASEPTGDCDDANATIYPGATEVVGDEVDQDCDGSETCYEDADGDGVRTSSTVVSADEDCADAGEAPSGVSDGDCDDADASVYPGATEVPGDGIDQDCDGTDAAPSPPPSSGCSSVSGSTSAWGLLGLLGLLGLRRRQRSG